MQQFSSLLGQHSAIAATSDEIAVYESGSSYTYRQFALFVKTVETKLVESGNLNGSPIAILMPRGFLAYACEIAVLKAGGFFLPIDPDNPLERIQFLISDSNAAQVLVVDDTQEQANSLTGDVMVTNVGSDYREFTSNWDDSQELGDCDLKVNRQPDDLVYMIYTSGSTGRPKGVPIHWSALQNHNEWFIDCFDISPSDRCLQMASVGFDISIEEIFTSLGGGATLYPIDKLALESPTEFFKWVEKHQLTVLNIPTALWHNLVPALKEVPLSESVRLVLIGGEQVKSKPVEEWFRHVPADKVRLVNAYGPTEATITCTVSDLSEQNLNSIGKPIYNVECHVVDPAGELIESPNTPGELYISGQSLSPGYWNRPEKTKESFVTCEQLGGGRFYRTGDKVEKDLDGNLHFLGRLDNQVKLRGFRIELDEIATCVSRHPNIENAIVRKVGEARPILACFATVKNSSKSEAELEADVTRFVRDTLPHYMVPQRFAFCDRFPTTVAGKVDVTSLVQNLSAETDSSSDELGQLTDTQQQVADIWKAVLGSYPEKIESTFEQSGGDSFAAMALAVQLEQTFSPQRFGVSVLLSCPSVKHLADHIEAESKAPKNSKDRSASAPTITSLGRPLSHDKQDAEGCDNCLIFFHPSGGGSYLYNELLTDEIKKNYSILLVDSPLLNSGAPDQSSETVVSIAQDYVEQLLPLIGAKKKIITAGYSFGANTAYEAAKLLKAQGHDLKLVINIDQPVISALETCHLGQRLSNWICRLSNPILTLEEMRDARKKNSVDATTITQADALSDDLLRSVAIENYYVEIEDNYEPEPCEIDLCLIRGKVYQAKYQLPEDYGWGRIVKNLEIRRITGTHATLFKGVHLSRLGKEAREIILGGNKHVGT